jgi:hypothetical protein
LALLLRLVLMLLMFMWLLRLLLLVPRLLMLLALTQAGCMNRILLLKVHDSASRCHAISQLLLFEPFSRLLLLQMLTCLHYLLTCINRVACSVHITTCNVGGFGGTTELG